MTDAARVLEQALALPPEERAELASALIASLGASDSGGERGVKLRALRAALDEGERGGVAGDSSLEGVLEEFRSARMR